MLKLLLRRPPSARHQQVEERKGGGKEGERVANHPRKQGGTEEGKE